MSSATPRKSSVSVAFLATVFATLMIHFWLPVGTNVASFDEDGTLLAALRDMALAPQEEKETRTVRHRLRALNYDLDVVTSSFTSGSLPFCLSTNLRSGRPLPERCC